MDDLTAALDELWPWATARGLTLTTEQRTQLRRYLEILLRWNQGMALVSQHDARAIAIKHFADSLIAAAAVRPDDVIADFGSGAGFPGLVIAIVRPTATVTLVESKQKKVSFLLEAIRASGAVNASALAVRIEALGRDPAHTGRYSVVVARALSKTEELLQWAQPLLRPGGRLLAMKGPGYTDELPSFERLRGLGFGDAALTSYDLPDGSVRVLLDFCFT